MIDAAYYRDKAEQCRALADIARHALLSDELARLAQEFEQQAAAVELRLDGAATPDAPA